MALVWVASVIVAGLAGAGAATLVSRTAADPQPIAILEATDEATWPSFILGERPEGAVLFEEHLGVQIVAVPQEIPGGSTRCLYAMSAEDLPRGAFTVGCGAGPFLPTLTSLVGADWPPELLEQYPIGSSVRYLLDGDRVLVYAAPPDTVPAPSSTG